MSDLYRFGERHTEQQPLVRTKRGRGDSRYNPASNPNRGRKRIRCRKYTWSVNLKSTKLMQNRSPEAANQPGDFARQQFPRCSTSNPIFPLHKALPAAWAPEGCHPKPRQIENNTDTEKQKHSAEFKEFLQWPGKCAGLNYLDIKETKSHLSQ